MRTLIAALLMVLAGAARASLPGCTTGPAPLFLQIPIANVATGSQWNACMQYDFTVLSTASISGPVTSLIIVQNGVSTVPYAAGYYPNAPLTIIVSTNAYAQEVGQNLSTGTAATYSRILTGALGGNTSYYFEEFINSPNFNVAGYGAEKSSSTGVASSDSDMIIEAGLNGGLNGAKSEKIIFITSNPAAGNIAGWIMEGTASGPGAWVFASSGTFLASGAAQFSLGTSSGILVGGTNNPICWGSLAAGNCQYGPASTGVSAVPTRQIFTTASTGTYTTPGSVRQLRIRMVGGGGGGGTSYNATGPGVPGGATSIAYVNVSSITANPGLGGTSYGSTALGASGGSAGAGSASFRIAGGSGAGAVSSAVAAVAGMGGSSCFGGGGASPSTGGGVGGAAAANSGGGGGGGVNGSGTGGGGGGAGECVELIINSPPATMKYTVGNGGAGGTGGVSAGGAGGSGIIIVDEFY